MNTQVRIASAEDADEIARIYVASKMASLPELVADYDHDLPFLTRRWRSYIAEGSRAQQATGEGFVFLAEADGRPVGYAAYHHKRRHDANAELQSIYVLKEAQGLGVGTALLRIITERLLQEGSASMCVGYDPGNPYKRFYLKHGAVEINPHWAIWRDVKVILSPGE